MSAMLTLGEWILAQREARGLSQDALAQALGLSPVRVAKWEAGEATPSLCEGALLFKEFGTSDADVLALLRELCIA